MGERATTVDDSDVISIAQNPAENKPSRPDKRSNKTMIIVIVIVAMVIVAAVAGIFLLNGNNAANMTEANITSSPAEISLQWSDFPSTWQPSTPIWLDIPQRANNGYDITAFNTTSKPEARVECQIIQYVSISNAERVYSEIKENVSAITTSDMPDHFTQCFKYEKDLGIFGEVQIYTFQERNVCGQIYFASSYLFDMSQTWIYDQLDKIEARIL